MDKRMELQNGSMKGNYSHIQILSNFKRNQRAAKRGNGTRLVSNKYLTQKR